MKSNFVPAVLAAALALPQLASAAPVDLSSWVSEGQGTWNVQSGNEAVIQSVNNQPTVFFESGSNARGTQLSGEIEVQTTGDDDFIGFVLGYQAGELSSAVSDYWLIDWKQADQYYNGGNAYAGLALSHVTSGTNVNSYTDFWTHSGGVTEVARGTNLGSTGWADNTSYSFDLVFTDQLLEVYVDGLMEISVTAGSLGISEFTDGAMGFYNYSQAHVQYAGITAEVANVSEPATFALLGLGLAGLGAVRKKKSA